jgi:hypothetical protein
MFNYYKTIHACVYKVICSLFFKKFNKYFYVPKPTLANILILSMSIANNNYYARFEVFTAVIMKDAVFWDIRTQFVPHRRHITSPLQSPAG